MNADVREEMAAVRAEIDEVRRRLADIALKVVDDEPSFFFATRSMESLESLDKNLRNAHYAWDNAEPPHGRM